MAQPNSIANPSPLRSLRKFRKPWLEQVASAACTDAGNLCRIECHLQPPSEALTKKLAKHIGFSLAFTHIHSPWRFADDINVADMQNAA